MYGLVDDMQDCYREIKRLKKLSDKMTKELRRTKAIVAMLIANGLVSQDQVTSCENFIDTLEK